GAGLARLLQAQQHPPQQAPPQQNAQQQEPHDAHEEAPQGPQQQEAHQQHTQEDQQGAPQAAHQQESVLPGGEGQVRDEAMLVELIAATDRMVSHYQAMQAQFVQELMMHRGDSQRGVTSNADESEIG